MECFLVFVVLVIAVTAVVTLAAAAQSRADSWNRSYQKLAKRFGGNCLSAGWFGRPSVRFRYGQTPVLLNTYKSAGNGFTQLFINWPDPNFQCEIYPDPNAPRNLALQTAEGEFDSSWEQFRRRYVLRANSDEEMRSLLSDGVQWQIERLRQLALDSELYVAVRRGRILVRKRALLVRYEELEEFAQLALELYDQAMLTRMTGIDFVDSEVAQIISEATCQVCGEQIITDMIFCRRCRTPHHHECWQYYGACAVYGCQETRWFAPRTAGP